MRTNKDKNIVKHHEITETQKTNLEKIFTQQKFLLTATRNKKKNYDQRLTKLNHGFKRPEHEAVKSAKFLRTYIKQKWKQVISLSFIYIIIFGAVVSTPFVVILVNCLKNTSQYEMEQERSKT